MHAYKVMCTGDGVAAIAKIGRDRTFERTNTTARLHCTRACIRMRMQKNFWGSLNELITYINLKAYVYQIQGGGGGGS